MKKLRLLYLGVAFGVLAGTSGASLNVFAEEVDSIETPTSSEEAQANSAEMLANENPDLSAEEIQAELDTENAEGSTDGEGSTDEGVSSETEDDDSLAKNVKIKSFNPGYSDIGEFLELSKLSTKQISLAGLTVIYVTSSGREYTVFEFPEGYEMVGESLLMRLASSSEVSEAEDYHEVADLTYTRNMAQSKGKVKLVVEGETVDLVCWGLEEDGCFSGFNAKKPTTLVRDFSAEEVEDSFRHVPVEEYAPSYDSEKPGLLIVEKPEEVVEPKCRALEFSEILTYFEGSRDEQFIELYNRGDEKIELSSCQIRYKGKVYNLSGEVGVNGFFLVYPGREWGLQLTKNPTSSNLLEIIDADGEVVDSLTYASGQRKGVSLAMVGFLNGKENWVQTFNVTPGAENVYQEFRTCPIGKVINLETGNCVNEATITTTLAACPEGKYRNPLTGRCKSYATTASAELKPCAEGYERNPATGRCRKIVENNGAEFPLEEETFRETREFVAIWAIVVVVLGGIVYIVFQYREEIREKFKK